MGFSPLNSDHLLQHLLTMYVLQHLLAMYVLLLANLLLFVQAEPLPETDEKCFNDNYKNKMVEPAPDNNGTFDVRVEHGGALVDIFTIGDLYTLELGQVKKINCSAVTIETICAAFNSQLAESQLCNGNKTKEVLPLDNRELLLVYNSSHVCGGMNEKKITITNTNYTIVYEKCNFHCMEANEDAPDMKFPYYDWVIDLPNTNNFTMKDTLTVKAGVGASICSVWLVCCLALLVKYI